jgi:PAS domain S-box-containing protein
MSSDDWGKSRPQSVALVLQQARERAREIGDGVADFARQVRSVVPPDADPTDPREVLLRIAEERLRGLHEELSLVCRYLEIERAKYLDELENTGEPHLVTDARGEVRDANRRAGALLAMPLHALRGKLLIGFVARQDTKVFRDRLRSLDSAGEVDPIELRMRPRGGDVFRATLLVRPIRDLGGERVLRYRWTLRPIPPPAT